VDGIDSDVHVATEPETRCRCGCISRSGRIRATWSLLNERAGWGVPIELTVSHRPDVDVNAGADPQRRIVPWRIVPSPVLPAVVDVG
jgi:hypothetical protein